MLGCISDDRDDHGRDEELGEADLLGECLERAHEDLRDECRRRPSRRRARRARSRATTPPPRRRSASGAAVPAERVPRDARRRRRAGRSRSGPRHRERVRFGIAAPAGTDGIEEADVATATSPSEMKARARDRSCRGLRRRARRRARAGGSRRRFRSAIRGRRRGGRRSTARSAMISSGAFPKVAFRNPPIPGPVCSAACSVASPMSQASGTSATRGEDELQSLRRMSDVVQRDRRAARARATRREPCVPPLAEPYRRVSQILPLSPLPENRVLVKSCAGGRGEHNSGCDRNRGRGRAPAPHPGRGGVPPLRRPLREGRLPAACLGWRARSSTRTRPGAIRTLGACRRSTTSRSTSTCSRRRRPDAVASVPSRPARAASDVRCRSRRDVPAPRGRPRLPHPRVPRAAP